MLNLNKAPKILIKNLKETIEIQYSLEKIHYNMGKLLYTK